MKKLRLIALVVSALCICAVLVSVLLASSRPSEPEQKPAWEQHFDAAIKALNRNNFAEWDREANLVLQESNSGKMPPQAAMDPEQRRVEQMFWFIPMQDRGETKPYTEALRDIARYYEEQKRLDDAERFQRKALELEIAEKKGNPKKTIYPGTSAMISFLQRRGKIKEALEFQKVEIEEAEKEADKWPDQQRKAAVLMAKAKAFEIERKYDRAEDCMKERVELYSNELSEENIARLRKENEKASLRESYKAGMFTLDKLNDLHEFYKLTNNFEGQESTLKQVLSIHEKILPKNCDLLTYDWEHLAGLYQYHKDYEKEAEALKQMIRFHETADAWMALSRALDGAGKYDEAIEAQKTNIRLHESSSKKEDPFWTAARYKDLAKLLDKTGKKDEAAQAREQAQKIDPEN